MAVSVASGRKGGLDFYAAPPSRLQLPTQVMSHGVPNQSTSTPERSKQKDGFAPPNVFQSGSGL